MIGFTLIVLGGTTDAAAAEPKPSEPTAEQILAAKEVYAKFGAIGVPVTDPTDPRTKSAKYIFVMRPMTGDDELKGMVDLPFGFALSLAESAVSDAGLKHLKRLKNLTALYLNGVKVTDSGLKDLSELKNLTYLGLELTHVTDAGIKELKELKNLQCLNLARTKVTDLGLSELKDLKNLVRLNIAGTKVTDTGERELKKFLTDCKIQR
jgi:hypothetical protein